MSDLPHLLRFHKQHQLLSTPAFVSPLSLKTQLSSLTPFEHTNSTMAAITPPSPTMTAQLPNLAITGTNLTYGLIASADSYIIAQRMRYRVRPFAQLVVSKVTAGRVPKEIADLIRDFLLDLKWQEAKNLCNGLDWGAAVIKFETRKFVGPPRAKSKSKSVSRDRAYFPTQKSPPVWTRWRLSYELCSQLITTYRGGRRTTSAPFLKPIPNQPTFQTQASDRLYIS